jgi:hypothetical protein
MPLPMYSISLCRGRIIFSGTYPTFDICPEAAREVVQRKTMGLCWWKTLGGWPWRSFGKCRETRQHEQIVCSGAAAKPTVEYSRILISPVNTKVWGFIIWTHHIDSPHQHVQRYLYILYFLRYGCGTFLVKFRWGWVHLGGRYCWLKLI